MPLYKGVNRCSNSELTFPINFLQYLFLMNGCMVCKIVCITFDIWCLYLEFRVIGSKNDSNSNQIVWVNLDEHRNVFAHWYTKQGHSFFYQEKEERDSEKKNHQIEKFYLYLMTRIHFDENIPLGIIIHFVCVF